MSNGKSSKPPVTPQAAWRAVNQACKGRCVAHLDRAALHDATERRLKDLLEAFIEVRTDVARDESKAALDAGDIHRSIELMVIVPEVDGIQIRNEVAFEVVDYDVIPDEYFERTLKNGAVKASLKDGVTIPGIVRKDRAQIAISTKD